MHAVLAAHVFDPCDVGSGAHVDADLNKTLHQPADQIRIEFRQYSLPALQYCDLCTSARRNMRELRSNVAAPDHDDTRGESREFHEGVAGDAVFRALKTGRD